MKKVTRMLASLAAVATMTVSAVPVCAEEQPSDVASAEYTLPGDGIFAEGAAYHFIKGSDALIIDGEGSFTVDEFTEIVDQFSPRSIVFGGKVAVPDGENDKWLMNLLSFDSTYAVYARRISNIGSAYSKMLNQLTEEIKSKGLDPKDVQIKSNFTLIPLDEEDDLYDCFTYEQAIIDRGCEMEQYLVENGIRKDIARKIVGYYLLGLNFRVQYGKENPDGHEIANADGTEVNERTTKYIRDKCLTTAKCEQDVIDEINEGSQPDNEISDFFAENGITGEKSQIMTLMYIAGSKDWLARSWNWVCTETPQEPIKFEYRESDTGNTSEPINEDESDILYLMNYNDNGELYGDVDGDGKVTIRDAAIISEKLACGTYEELPENSDFNQDGSINIKDAVAITKALKNISLEKDETKDTATLKGDADVNGEVGLSDVVAVSKHNINSTAYPLANENAEANADMNNDNVVDGLDTQALVEYNLGKK